MKKLITRAHTHLALLRDDEFGGNLIEYALLIAFIALAAVFGITQVGQQTASNLDFVIPNGPHP